MQTSSCIVGQSKKTERGDSISSSNGKSTHIAATFHSFLSQYSLFYFSARYFSTDFIEIDEFALILACSQSESHLHPRDLATYIHVNRSIPQNTDKKQTSVYYSAKQPFLGYGSGNFG